MRWPLKNQIFLRMVLLVLLAIAAVTLAQIQLAISVNRQWEQQRGKQIGDFLANASFPLTPTILEDMKSLSGAEFVLTNEAGAVVSRSQSAPQQIPETTPEQASTGVNVTISEAPFFYRVIRTRAASPGVAANVHLFVPRPSTAEIWWQASQGPLLSAGIVLPIALLISLAMASHLTRPLQRLGQQANDISRGEWSAVEPMGRDDEIRDLQRSINDMASTLQQQQDQLRKNERWQALAQFGDSIAHHIRNSATGCRMAIELAAADNETLRNGENLRVALRQLDLIDNNLKKFLLLSKGARPETQTAVSLDLAQVLSEVLKLLRPTAEHLNVELVVQVLAGNQIAINREDAEQLMINLIGNAIDAASEPAGPGQVVVTLDLRPDQTPSLQVADNGSGPPAAIADQIFEPFVTGKTEGTGLGLALVQEIATRCGGSVDWRREGGSTVFEFQFTSDHQQQESNS